MSVRSLIVKSISIIALVSSLFWQTSAFSTPCGAESTCVTINGEENSLSKEKARQSQENWNEQRRLRQKVDKRREKEFDKYEVEADNREACLKSANINAYWEPSTKRCLDINTGLPVKP
ncbi:DUF1283 family protein [Xenorhabdus kozodoii]|uniref:Uncharacterized protein n=1 Tax=Xenorhabdus kozodoii TaxID=351676 RepID=A0A2D0LFL9_9GAMM|nr:DUF1283 family protein [Xenorhabdus kozodoii]PHM74217.1 hypothetical protein Xkoz_01103 [Xenorhabdus kozodoii]